MVHGTTRRSVICVATIVTLLGVAHGAAAAPPAPKEDRPNILFIILDDVGIDQLASFNPYHPDPPVTPTLDAIASQGVSFTRFITMPECSPTRAAFFTGRYPLRTGVTAAIFEAGLPRAQVSPDEVTLPRLLRGAGHASAMLGKYHLLARLRRAIR